MKRRKSIHKTKTSPARTLSVVLLIFGFAFFLQHQSFYKKTPEEKVESAAQARSAKFPNADSPERSILQDSKTKADAPKSESQPDISALSQRYQTHLAAQGLVHVALKKELAKKMAPILLGKIAASNKPDLQHLYPHWTERRYPGHRNEIFVNYDIKIQGFSVPQSHLRTMLFEVSPQDYQISFIDHQFLLPPTTAFSVRIPQSEALHKALVKESKTIPLWRAEKQWYLRQKEWKPTWKIQLLGSANTYFVDVRDGHVDVEKSDLGLEQPQQLWQIEGRGTPFLGHATEWTSLPLANLLVLSRNQQKLWTDHQGHLQTDLPVPSLQPRLSNEFVEVFDSKDRSPDLMIRAELYPPRLILNPKQTAEQTAMVNAFVAIGEAHNFLLTKNHFRQETLDRPLKAYVNLDLESCNAKYRNGVVAFYQESEDCRNTAYDTVIYHEYTHFVDDLHGGITDLSLSEGMGDILATFLSRQPLIGQELYKVDLSPQRNADNQVLYRPPTDEAINYTALYERAQAWSGFAWHARQALVEKYGETEGASLAAFYFLTLLETNAPDIPSALAEALARSSQGHALDQTTDALILSKAAKQHGLLR